METPNLPIEIPAENQRKRFIAVVNDCVPSGDKDNFRAAVHDLLRNNGINESPKVVSSYGCSFSIDLGQEQYDRLSNSKDLVLSLDQNLIIN